MQHPTEKMEFLKQAALGTPPAAVAGMTLLSLPLSEWVFVATILYILVQIFFLLYRWYRLIKMDRQAESAKVARIAEDA